MINLTNVTIKINKNKLFKNETISFEEGKCHGIVGRNGSGKSILFKAICGFIELDSGSISIGEKHINGVTSIDNLGVIIETPNFINRFTALQNLTCLAEIRKKIDEKQIIQTLKNVGLENAVNKKYKQFSLGMKQRLRIAQAIMENPDYYILDEPFNGLDEQGVQEIYVIIQNLKKQGKTILMTSHDDKDIKTLCDTIYEIKDEKIHEV